MGLKETNLGIGIHCTHGVNRTGYIAVSCMVEMRKMGVEEAIKEFEDKRGHIIDKDYLRNDLK